MKTPHADYPAFYRKIYDTIGALTPLETDCGRLCGARCCRGGPGDGMLLFPHEEEALDHAVWRPVAVPEGLFVSCSGVCERASRPLACRIFPLTPLLGTDGIVRVAADPGAWRVCPLVRQLGAVRFSRDFVRAVRRAGRLLTRDPDCLRELKARAEQARDLLRLLDLPDGGLVSGRRF